MPSPSLVRLSNGHVLGVQSEIEVVRRGFKKLYRFRNGNAWVLVPHSAIVVWEYQDKRVQEWKDHKPEGS
jgi:hypothetical protein